MAAQPPDAPIEVPSASLHPAVQALLQSAADAREKRAADRELDGGQRPARESFVSNLPEDEAERWSAIKQFVPGVSLPLDAYEAVTPDLADIRAKYQQPKPRSVPAGLDDCSRVRQLQASPLSGLTKEGLVFGNDGDKPSEPKDTEKKVYFRVNATGNIMYSTTTDGEVSDKAKDLFDSVSVLFAAITAALAQHGKKLMDYEAVSTLIRKSGYFIHNREFFQHTTIKSSSLSLDMQLIGNLLPGLTGGSSLKIMQEVLSSISGTYGASDSKESTKLCHLMFICEDLFAAPNVSVKLYKADKEQMEKVTESPCHKTVRREIELTQHGDTFMFVDPARIRKFAKDYDPNNRPEAYDDLIQSLAGHLGPQKD